MAVYIIQGPAKTQSNNTREQKKSKAKQKDDVRACVQPRRVEKLTIITHTHVIRIFAIYIIISYIVHHTVCVCIDTIHCYNAE